MKVCVMHIRKQPHCKDDKTWHPMPHELMWFQREVHKVCFLTYVCKFCRRRKDSFMV
jgi:hypothetical protein